MPTITYDELISSFLRKGEILNLFTEEITDEYRNEFLWGLIYSAISDPYVSRLFSNFTINDPIEKLDEEGEVVVDEETGEPVIIEGHIEYELVRKINVSMDKLFIMDVIGYGMIIQWLMPLVYLQRKLIRDRGLTNNSYIDGTSASSKLRSSES